MSPELARDLDRIRRCFPEVQTRLTAEGILLVRVLVQGVEVSALVHPVEALERAPTLYVSPAMVHAMIRGGRVDRLDAQRRWNRTLGLSALLSELDLRFRLDPPARRGDPVEVARYLLRALVREPR